MTFGISGLCVVFGGQDLEGEFFDAQSDFNLDIDRGEQPIYYDHGFDQVVGKQRIGKGTLHREANGVRLDGTIEVAAGFGSTLKRLIASGDLGFSTGSLAHVTRREDPQPDGRVRIAAWTLSEISLTSTPAEVRCTVALKKSIEQVRRETAVRMVALELDEQRRRAYANHLRIKNLVRRHELGI